MSPFWSKDALTLSYFREVRPLNHAINAIQKAEDGIRTRDPQLGKLMLYQLSYFRTYRQQDN